MTTATLQTFRGDFGGVTPDKMSEYYRSSSIVGDDAGVPDTVGCAGVPTSGTIKFSQLDAAYKTSSQQTICTHVWNNLSTHLRRGAGDNSWQSITGTWDRTNTPVNRYVSSFTISGTITPGATPNHSPWHTIVVALCGPGVSISSVQPMGGGTAYSAFSTHSTTSIKFGVYHIPAYAVTSTNWTVDCSRSSGNSGAWVKVLSLPGKWYVAESMINFLNTTQFTLTPGEIGWFMAEGGYDANATPTEAGTTGYTVRGSEWWYNNCAHLIRFNPTSSNRIAQAKYLVDGYDAYYLSNRLFCKLAMV